MLTVGGEIMLHPLVLIDYNYKCEVFSTRDNSFELFIEKRLECGDVKESFFEFATEVCAIKFALTFMGREPSAN